MVLVQVAVMLHVTIDGYSWCTWVAFRTRAIKEQKLIYNISWEDPRVEREDLKLSSGDVVLTISSAGCNMLDCLLEKPKHVTAAYLNEAQLAVLDLKLSCVTAKIPKPDFFALWGRSDPHMFTENY